MGFPSLHKKMPDFPTLVEDTNHNEQLKIRADRTQNSTHTRHSEENNNSVKDTSDENNKQELIQNNSKFIYSIL